MKVREKISCIADELGNNLGIHFPFAVRLILGVLFILFLLAIYILPWFGIDVIPCNPVIDHGDGGDAERCGWGYYGYNRFVP